MSITKITIKIKIKIKQDQNEKTYIYKGLKYCNPN